jgi:hypothetical protein
MTDYPYDDSSDPLLDDPNDPLDDELDAAMISALELVAHVKQMQSTELELPVVDDSGAWIVTVKRMGILDEK